MTTTPVDALRAWARGAYPSEASVELLIRCGRVVYDGAPWIMREGDRAWINVDELPERDGILGWWGAAPGAYRRLTAGRPTRGPVRGHTWS